MELYVLVKLSIFDNWERFADRLSLIPFRFIARSQRQILVFCDIPVKNFGVKLIIWKIE